MPATRIEPTPLVPSNEFTPLLLGHQGQQDLAGDLPPRKLFSSAEFSDPEATDSDSDGNSSTIDSPRGDAPIDYLIDSSVPSSNSEEFSTDVSSTRKSRRCRLSEASSIASSSWQ